MSEIKAINSPSTETEFCHGYLARCMGDGIGQNPYQPGSPMSIAWAEGWRDADEDTIHGYDPLEDTRCE